LRTSLLLRISVWIDLILMSQWRSKRKLNQQWTRKVWKKNSHLILMRHPSLTRDIEEFGMAKINQLRLSWQMKIQLLFLGSFEMEWSRDEKRDDCQVVETECHQEIKFRSCFLYWEEIIFSEETSHLSKRSDCECQKFHSSHRPELTRWSKRWIAYEVFITIDLTRDYYHYITDLKNWQLSEVMESLMNFVFFLSKSPLLQLYFKKYCIDITVKNRN